MKYQDEEMSLETLAERFYYKVCHLDIRLGWRSKRVAVNIHGFDTDILIIYRKDRGLWKPFFLISTFSQEHTMAELLMLWKARWGIEVVHRFIKQNLGFAKPQLLHHCPTKLGECCVGRIFAVLQVKSEMKLKSWRAAQKPRRDRIFSYSAPC